jgi:cytoskeletal protein CcmA (bactofilin family)
MGFFSDLKEDLSQAVNELMPVGEEQPEQEPTARASETKQPTKDEKKDKAADKTADKAEPEGLETSLEEMLKNIDEIEVSEENAADSETEGGPLEDMLAAALEAIPEHTEDAGTSETKTETEFQQEETDETEMTAGETVQETPSEKDIQQTSEQETIEGNKGAEKKMDSYANRQASDETAVITMGMQIHGDVISEGSMDVIGTVDGNIDILGKLNITGHLNGNSKAAEIYAEGAKINGELVSEGAVKIGVSSVIIGNITAKSAAIAGAVKGDIDVQGPVILDASAIVMGNIKSKSVQINNGAVIEGMCSQCYADVSPTSFFDDYKPDTMSTKKTK